ncbi:MAG: hypothetical protein GX096_05980 [Clostridiales bacterium]|nr:hypothetical protein [Clostridiales bacterium]
MAIFISIVILGVYFCIMGFLASKISDAAERKGYEKRTYFHICFWLGVLGFLVVIALPDLTIQQQNEKMIRLLEAGNSTVSSNTTSNPTSGNQSTPYAQSIQLPSL